jgi:hypothetical protein
MISEPKTRLETKLMAYKLLRKCHKEEVPTCIVEAVAQCTKGTALIWIPYLLNLFLDDFKYAHYMGTKVNYSWIIISIALVGWKHPKYTIFL